MNCKKQAKHFSSKTETQNTSILGVCFMAHNYVFVCVCVLFCFVFFFLFALFCSVSSVCLSVFIFNIKAFYDSN